MAGFKRGGKRRFKKYGKKVSKNKTPMGSIHVLTRTIAQTPDSLSNAAYTAPVYYYNLSVTLSSNDLLDYREYKIIHVTQRWIPSYNIVSITGLDTTTNKNFVVLFYSAIDHNDTNNSAAAGGDQLLLNYPNSHIHRSDEISMLKFRPKPLTMASITGTFSNANRITLSSDPWLSTKSNTIDHLGVKVWYPQLATANSCGTTMYLYATYTILLRNISPR